MLISKMADAREPVCEYFPSKTLLQELISSFPYQWQGLFASLNVKESLAVHSGTKWLRDNSFSLQKNFVCPHWPDFVRSLCQMFPVVLNQNVIFQSKFACFTLRLRRNIMCFIVYHSESIPADDMKVFVSMVVKLPQMKQPWCMALVSTLQAQLNNRELETENTGIENMKSRNFDLNNNTKTLKIPDCNISESNKLKLHNLCSRINATSSPSHSFLSTKLELMETLCEDQIEATRCKKPNIDQDQFNPVADMEVDNYISLEVIEISDDSLEASPSSSKKVIDSPATPKIIDITENSPVISPTTKVLNLPDYSSLPETKELIVNPLVALSTTHLSEVPNPPELEIQGMEVEPSAQDPITDKYAHLKNHLTASEDLDVELIQEFTSRFVENTPKTLEAIFKFLEMNTIPETSAVMLIRQFLLLENECSFQSTVIFAEYCISLWLGTLQQAGSRNLLATVGAFAQKHPKAFVEGVMVKQFQTTCLLWPQCDLILKIVKNLEKETLQYFMEKVLQSKESEASSVWNDHMIQLLSAILERRLDLDASKFKTFVKWLQLQTLPLASSLKFAKLLLMLINKYGPLVKSSLGIFKQILEENNTFLKKSALTALKKLEV